MQGWEVNTKVLTLRTRYFILISPNCIYGIYDEFYHLNKDKISIGAKLLTNKETYIQTKKGT